MMRRENKTKEAEVRDIIDDHKRVVDEPWKK
jgi:hypothetical protein